jgi:transposase
MEDVLEVYHRPYDPRFPQVCLDETSKPLLDHVRVPLRPKPGVPLRVDDEYRRCGTTNIFLAVEPLVGRVVTEPTEKRAFVDFALFLRRLADEVYPSAERIVLVMDNLSTHTPAALYEAFEPEEARRLTKKFEIHYTPKHGSWLNIAEIQLSVLARQALDQRIASMIDLRTTLDAWHAQRAPSPVRWRFSTEAARSKLRRLYPALA